MGQVLLSCFQVHESGLPELLPTESALLCPLGEMPDLFFCILKPVRGKNSTPALVSPGASCPAHNRLQGTRRGASFSHPCHCMTYEEVSGQLSSCFALQVSSPASPPRGSALLCFPGEVQCLFSSCHDHTSIICFYLRSLGYPVSDL